MSPTSYHCSTPHCCGFVSAKVEVFSILTKYFREKFVLKNVKRQRHRGLVDLMVVEKNEAALGAQPLGGLGLGLDAMSGDGFVGGEGFFEAVGYVGHFVKSVGVFLKAFE